MTAFRWPDHIKFDDTASDINEARRAWLAARGGMHSENPGDFLEFMQAYAGELEKRRIENVSTQKYA
jgi:hypothetical protein